MLENQLGHEATEDICSCVSRRDLVVAEERKNSVTGFGDLKNSIEENRDERLPLSRRTRYP